MKDVLVVFRSPKTEETIKRAFSHNIVERSARVVVVADIYNRDALRDDCATLETDLFAPDTQISVVINGGDAHEIVRLVVNLCMKAGSEVERKWKFGIFSIVCNGCIDTIISDPSHTFSDIKFD